MPRYGTATISWCNKGSAHIQKVVYKNTFYKIHKNRISNLLKKNLVWSYLLLTICATFAPSQRSDAIHIVRNNSDKNLQRQHQPHFTTLALNTFRGQSSKTWRSLSSGVKKMTAGGIWFTITGHFSLFIVRHWHGGDPRPHSEFSVFQRSSLPELWIAAGVMTCHRIRLP